MLDAEIEVAGVRWSWKMQVCSECTQLLCLHEPVQNAIWLCQLAAFLCVLTEELKYYTSCNTLEYCGFKFGPECIGVRYQALTGV